MGGYGSSRWGWRSKKATVEECRSLDVTRWQAEGIVGPDLGWVGSWQWRDSDTNEKRATISVDVMTGLNAGQVRLHYTVTRGKGEPQLLDYIAPLVTTCPYYGGLRWWFRCPNTKCGRRVRKLYLPPGGLYFLCRQCNDLAYSSSQEHNKARDRFRRLDYGTLAALLQDGASGADTMGAATELLDRAYRAGKWGR